MDFLYPLVFWVLAALIAVSAIAMVVTQNIVRAATWLLFTLAGVAGIFFLLGADFVGATQLLVYVGGTLVLVVFGVMLTAQGPFINLRIAAGEWAIAAAVGVTFFSVLAFVLVREDFGPHESLAVGAAIGPGGVPEKLKAEKDRSLAPSIVLGAALLGYENTAPDAPVTGLNEVIIVPGETGAIVPPGAAKPRLLPPEHRVVRSRTKVAYLLPFEIVSVHLLVVLVGAAYLARSKRRRGAAS